MIRFASDISGWEGKCKSVCVKLATKYITESLANGSNVRRSIVIDPYICVFKVEGNDAKVLITSRGFKGFLARPRVGKNGSGYTEEGNVLTPDEGTVGVFPIVDGDDKIFTFNKGQSDGIALTSAASSWIAEGPDVIDHGNVDWKGPETDDPAERKILTYKGNPSRYWPVGYFTNISGLSVVDHVSGGDLTLESIWYTVFGEYIYENGTVLEKMPNLYTPFNSDIKPAQVLGAAYRKLDDKLIVAIKTSYGSYPRTKAVGELLSSWQVWVGGVFYEEYLADEIAARDRVVDLRSHGVDASLKEVPDPGRGYFIEFLLRKDGDVEGGWTRLSRHPFGAMPDCNIFFNESGTEATTVMFGNEYTFAVSDTSVTMKEKSVGGFTQKISYTVEDVRKENFGKPDPEQAGGIFSAMYVVGVNSGDYKTQGVLKRIFNIEYSGSKTLATDYMGDRLVSMSVSVDKGSKLTYTEESLGETKWGYCAMPPYYAQNEGGDQTRTPGIAIIDEPFDEFGEFRGYYTVNHGGACKPKLTGTGTMVLNPDGTPTGRFDLSAVEFELCENKPERLISITASVTDEVTGRKATVNRDYTEDAVIITDLSASCTERLPSNPGSYRWVIDGGVKPYTVYAWKCEVVIYVVDGVQTGSECVPAWVVLSDLGELERSLGSGCHIENQCPMDPNKYKVIDACGSVAEFATTIGPTNAPGQIKVYGPAVWTGNLGDYYATGGYDPLAWIPASCSSPIVIAGNCPIAATGDFLYKGELEVTMPGYWSECDPGGLGAGVCDSIHNNYYKNVTPTSRTWVRESWCYGSYEGCLGYAGNCNGGGDYRVQCGCPTPDYCAHTWACECNQIRICY